MKLSLTFLATLLSFTLFAQKSTYFGLEAGTSNDKFKFNDRGNAIKSITLINAVWGFTLRQEIFKNLSIESGLLRKNYSEGYGFRASYPIRGHITSSMDVWQIPLRLKYQFNISKNKLFLTPTVGYHYCINPGYGSYGSGGGRIVSNNDTILYNDTTIRSSAKAFSLIETGLALEYAFSKRMMFSVSASYFAGLNRTIHREIHYAVNGTPNYATADSRGQYWYLGLGLRYKISGLWAKGKEE